MKKINPRINSRGSSSSSDSMKLILDHQIERYDVLHSGNRDLFDMLLEEQSQSEQDGEDILRTIAELNLSPRQQQQTGCKCSKIDCLKMYCECFAKGRLCTEKCECSSCCNRPDCSHQIHKAQQLANFRHPGTFKGVPAFVPQRKCTCKKSECRKNYCECYRAGIKCSQECECLGCQNGKSHSHHPHYLDSRMEIEVNA